jgi:branched-chain amino acid transport system permease protein
MNTLIQTLVTGVLIGGMYGLFSTGFSLVFGVTRVVNFAHGALVTLGMYGAVVLFDIGVNPLIALIPVAVVMFGLGILIYVTLLRRSVSGTATNIGGMNHTQLVITFGLALIIENALQIVFSPDPQSINGFLSGSLQIGNVFINETQLVAFVIAVIIFAALFLVIRFTELGRALRATVDSLTGATLVGISPGRMYALAFGVGAALAGIAGAVMVMYYPVVPGTGTSLLTIAFVVVVLGGIGSIEGAFIAGIIVGVVQQLTATYWDISLQNVGIFAVFILVLLFRPRGLMGKEVLR